MPEMKVSLAGMNVDSALLSEGSTPETISAAFARISRSTKSISDLRKEAIRDVEKARKSNETIVYDYGHSSIAEHAVFNFEISGISRLAVEALEHFRLASFTEKSQRYTQLTPNSFILPSVVNTDMGLAEKLINHTFETYTALTIDFERFYTYVGFSKNESHLKAIEDARYVLPLATTTQVGMTINARELEHMIFVMSGSSHKEVRDLAKALYTEVAGRVPSLIKYVDNPNIKPFHQSAVNTVVRFPGLQSPKIISVSEDYDQLLKFGILQSATSIPLDFFNVSDARLPQIDRELPRVFELIHVVFQGVLSEVAFNQLKRHRMSTLLLSPISNQIGFYLPKVFSSAGKQDEMKMLFQDVLEAQKFYSECDDLALYLSPNGTMRTFVVGMNLRSLFHFLRLRTNPDAQQEIQGFAKKLLSVLRLRLPALQSVLEILNQ